MFKATAIVAAIMGLTGSDCLQKPATADRPDAKSRLSDIGLQGIELAGTQQFTMAYTPASGTYIPTFVHTPVGVQFSQVKLRSPADKAGLKSGDIILDVDGQATWPVYLMQLKGGALAMDEDRLLRHFGSLVNKQGKSTWKVWRPDYSDPDRFPGSPSFKELTLEITLP